MVDGLERTRALCSESPKSMLGGARYWAAVSGSIDSGGIVRPLTTKPLSRPVVASACHD